MWYYEQQLKQKILSSCHLVYVGFCRKLWTRWMIWKNSARCEVNRFHSPQNFFFPTIKRLYFGLFNLLLIFRMITIKKNRSKLFKQKVGFDHPHPVFCMYGSPINIGRYWWWTRICSASFNISQLFFIISRLSVVVIRDMILILLPCYRSFVCSFAYSLVGLQSFIKSTHISIHPQNAWSHVSIYVIKYILYRILYIYVIWYVLCSSHNNKYNWLFPLIVWYNTIDFIKWICITKEKSTM